MGNCGSAPSPSPSPPPPPPSYEETSDAVALTIEDGDGGAAPDLPVPTDGGVTLEGVDMAGVTGEGDDDEGDSRPAPEVEEGDSGKKIAIGEKFRRSSVARPPDAIWQPDMGKPAMKTGWAWKQGHMYKNWKKRYFVLYEGTLKYYADYDESTGKAKSIKDSVVLKDYVFGVLPDMGNKIYIKPDKEVANVAKEKDLLLDFYEADGVEPEEECHDWTKALSQHILYANSKNVV